MKNVVIASIVFFASAFTINGQQINPSPQITPVPSMEIQPNVRRGEERNRRFDREKSVGNQVSTQNYERRQIFFQTIEPLYRKLTNEELQMLAPNAEDLRKFAAFLKLPKTGIIKLMNDFGCADNPSVLVVTPNCLKYTMPGAGSSFSFRTNSYRIQRLADLTFSGHEFKVTGIWLHGILTNLGDVSLDQVSINTNEAKFLQDFIPANNPENAAEIEKNLAEGIKLNGSFYRNRLAAEENRTYLLRSIAYRGIFYRAVQRVTYNELDFDKREDIIVAFRIIRKDETDGSITILWKELLRRKSPILKAEKNKKEE